MMRTRRPGNLRYARAHSHFPLRCDIMAQSRSSYEPDVGSLEQGVVSDVACRNSE